jgi:hypothetical protein
MPAFRNWLATVGAQASEAALAVATAELGALIGDRVFDAVANLPNEPAPGVYALVTFDPDDTKIGLWKKTGAAGSAGWVGPSNALRGPGLTAEQEAEVGAAIDAGAAAQEQIAEALQQVAGLTGATISYPGDPMLALRDEEGKWAVLVDENGYPAAWLPEGFVPVMDAGRLAMSPGVIDGEAITFFQCDHDGNVIQAYGAMGGCFILVGTEFVRCNADVFGRKAVSVRYASQTWTDGAKEVLSRPIGVKTAYIFIGMGQSNYDGHNDNAADALISPTPTYPDFALMLEGGPRVATTTGTATLVPLIENVVNRGGDDGRQRETPTSGWVNHFIRDWHAAWSDYPTVVGLSIAVGGTPYLGQKKGSFAFSDLHKGLTNAVAALRAQGFNDIRTVIGWVGGESDTLIPNMTKDWMAKMLRQLRYDAGDIIRRITGEIQNPPVIMIQPSFSHPDLSPWNQTVRQAVVDLDGEEGFVLAGPAYQYPMTGSSVPADNHIHRGNLGKYSTGIPLARGTMAQLLGATWHGVKPLQAYWSNGAGTQITIECDSMGSALVEDTSGAISTAGLANKGFDFIDGSASSPTITSIALTGLSVIITLSAKPVGPRCRIGYAIDRNSDQHDADGPIVGARGTIRDNAAYVRISDGATVYDWMPGFILDLPRP